VKSTKLGYKASKLASCTFGFPVPAETIGGVETLLQAGHDGLGRTINWQRAAGDRTRGVRRKRSATHAGHSGKPIAGTRLIQIKLPTWNAYRSSRLLIYSAAEKRTQRRRATWNGCQLFEPSAAEVSRGDANPRANGSQRFRRAIYRDRVGRSAVNHELQRSSSRASAQEIQEGE